MIDPAALSLSTTEASPYQRVEPPAESGAQFSYALAAASLEAQASQSLKVHGATPSGDIGAASKSGVAKPDASGEGQSTQATEQPERTAPKAERFSTEPPSTHDQAAGGQPRTAATASASSSMVATFAPAPVTAPQGKGADLLSVRDASSLKDRAALDKAPRFPPQPAALKAEFAEILARRLEKTSVFDLRLDPPEMGRVEGRLTVDDKGKAVLSLTFDNQNAFDLYSRDEQALRQALQHAGLDFSAGDFVFSFKQPPRLTIPAQAIVAAPSEASALYEPLFNASWSAGALDIRI
jgi:flagellar hook-length control protein FliK